MNLRDLAYLVAVADASSFRKAATACRVSQPTLSIQIGKLEDELGVILVDRQQTPIALTPAGHEVVRRARILLGDVAELRTAALASAGNETNELRLGAFPTLGAYLMPHATARIRQSFPSLKILVTEAKTDILFRLLDARKLDAILAALPVQDDAYVVRPLFREDFVLATPVDHDLAAVQTPLVPQDLAGHELIIMAEGHCLGDQVKNWMPAFNIRARTDHVATTLESLRSTTAAGGGITLLPTLAVSPPVHRIETISLRRFTPPVPGRDIALVWRRSSAQTKLLDKLAALLVPQGVTGIRSLL